MDIENDFESCLKCFEKWYGRREDAYMANETGIHRNKAWTFDVFAPDAGGYAGVACVSLILWSPAKRAA